MKNLVYKRALSIDFIIFICVAVRATFIYNVSLKTGMLIKIVLRKCKVVSNQNKFIEILRISKTILKIFALQQKKFQNYNMYNFIYHLNN